MNDNRRHEIACHGDMSDGFLAFAMILGGAALASLLWIIFA